MRLAADADLRARLSAAGLAAAASRSWDDVFGRLLDSMAEASSGTGTAAG
jgi:hypothetical protein